MIQFLRILTGNRIKEDQGDGNEKSHGVAFSTIRRRRLGTERQRVGAWCVDKRRYIQISQGLQ